MLAFLDRMSSACVCGGGAYMTDSNSDDDDDGIEYYNKTRSDKARNDNNHNNIVDVRAISEDDDDDDDDDNHDASEQKDKLAGLRGSVFRTKRVVYPIENYPYPLNHRYLIEQRRQAVTHQLFRPVSDDEATSTVSHPRRGQ